MARFEHILFMGHFEKPPVAGAMFFNGLIHTEKELWSLLNRAKVVIEVEHATPCRRCYYRKYLRLFKGYKFLLMWDYVTRRNFLKNYVQGYDRIFSVHAGAEKEICDRWGRPAIFWPTGMKPTNHTPSPITQIVMTLDFVVSWGNVQGGRKIRFITRGEKLSMP